MIRDVRGGVWPDKNRGGSYLPGASKEARSVPRKWVEDDGRFPGIPLMAAK